MIYISIIIIWNDEAHQLRRREKDCCGWRRPDQRRRRGKRVGVWRSGNEPGGVEELCFVDRRVERWRRCHVAVERALSVCAQTFEKFEKLLNGHIALLWWCATSASVPSDKTSRNSKSIDKCLNNASTQTKNKKNNEIKSNNRNCDGIELTGRACDGERA